MAAKDGVSFWDDKNGSGFIIVVMVVNIINVLGTTEGYTLNDEFYDVWIVSESKCKERGEGEEIE